VAPRLEVFRLAGVSSRAMMTAPCSREWLMQVIAASQIVSDGGASAPLFVCSKQAAAT
jgi:hypothetical protein